MKALFSTLLIIFSLSVFSAPTSAQDASPIGVQELPSYVGIGVQLYPAMSSVIDDENSIIAVLITGLVCGGPADRAGLKSFDSIISVDDRVVGMNGSLLLYEQLQRGDFISTVKSEQDYNDMVTSITSGDVGGSIQLKIMRRQPGSPEDDSKVLDVILLREQFTNPQIKQDCN